MKKTKKFKENRPENYNVHDRNLMVHVFFGKGVGVATGLLLGVPCQVVD